MADVRREPKLPPIETPLLEADGRTMTKPWYRYYQGERGFTDNINSGAARAEAAAAQARADAAAAQATADAASQSASDVAASALSFSASASPASAAGSREGTGPVTTNSTTVSASGGTAPYTYAWAYVSGYAGLTTDSPTSATTTWSGNISVLGQDRSAVYRCTVTDFVAATTSVTVGVSISEIS